MKDVKKIYGKRARFVYEKLYNIHPAMNSVYSLNYYDFIDLCTIFYNSLHFTTEDYMFITVI